MIQIGEKSRTDYDKRVKHLQKEIDRTDEYKEKMQEFELKFKSKLKFFFFKLWLLISISIEKFMIYSESI